MARLEDDFWNTSDHSGFNFDDEDEASPTLAETSMFATSKELSSELPIHAIISKESLNQILIDVASNLPSCVVPAEDTILRLIDGYPCDLNSYINFNDKLNLLREAVESCDGDVIIKVILFLRQTLKPNIFYLQLSKQKVAVRHYIYYLLMKNLMDELGHLCMATGNTSKMKCLFHLTTQTLTNKSVIHSKLEQFIAERPVTVEDKASIQDYIQLTKLQIDTGSSTTSVITLLAEICIYELRSSKNMDKINEFKDKFKIDDYSFEWVLLNVLATLQRWPDLVEKYTKNNWFTKKHVFKSAIPSECLILALSRHKPPNDLLSTFLNCLSDTSTALMLAKKLHCHSFIISNLADQKDRLALLEYRKQTAVNSPEYFLIENHLTSNIKWKN